MWANANSFHVYGLRGRGSNASFEHAKIHPKANRFTQANYSFVQLLHTYMFSVGQELCDKKKYISSNEAIGRCGHCKSRSLCDMKQDKANEATRCDEVFL